jgi:hypothetical protein
MLLKLDIHILILILGMIKLELGKHLELYFKLKNNWKINREIKFLISSNLPSRGAKSSFHIKFTILIALLNASKLPYNVSVI